MISLTKSDYSRKWQYPKLCAHKAVSERQSQP